MVWRKVGDLESRPSMTWPNCLPFLELIFFFLKNIYLAAPGLSCSMWDLVPRPGMELEPPALRERSLSQWLTREVPGTHFSLFI